jgi:hypothetical protein
MVRQRVKSVLGTWRGRFTVALIILILFVSGGYIAGYVVTTYGATSLDITVWKAVSGQYPPIPNVTIFHKTIMNLGLVRAAQHQIDGAPESSGWDGCIHIQPTYYVYQIRFATGNRTTQVYEGNSLCGGWYTTPFGLAHLLKPLDLVYINEATLDGVELLIALHEKTGMPLPPGDSGWTPDT